MSAPVIDPTTSVLGYKQWEEWEYQPFATYGPGRWQNTTGLPTGLSLDIATGKLSGPVQVPGVFNVGLIASNGYEVTRIACKADVAGALAGAWIEITGASGMFAYWFKVGGTGSAPSTSGTEVEVDIAEDATAATVAAALEAAMLAQNQWYVRRDGAVIYAYDLALGTRTNATDGGTPTGFLVSTLSEGAASATASAEVMFTIGIEPAALIDDLLPMLTIDTVTGDVLLDGTGATEEGDSSYLLSVKEGDDLLLRVGFVRSGTPVSVTAATDAIRLVLKQFEPEGELTASLESTAESGTSNYLLHARFDGAAITAALSDYEADDGTFFYALAEVEATLSNPFYGTCGPETVIRTSATFRIRIERDIANNA